MHRQWQIRNETGSSIKVMDSESKLKRWEGPDGVVLAIVKRGKLVISDFGAARGYEVRGLDLERSNNGQH